MECCEWWSAMLSIRRAPLKGDQWKMAMHRCLNQHCRRRGLVAAKGKLKSVNSWNESAMRMLSQHQKRVTRSDGWGKAIERVAKTRPPTPGKRRTLSVTLCPECAAIPEWARRCVMHHRGCVHRATRSDWEIRFLGSLAGLRKRISRPAKEKKKATEWKPAIDRALASFKNRKRKHDGCEWHKWALKTSSRIQQRAAIRAAKARQQQESS